MANDTVNVQRGIVGAGSDDDTYVLSASLIDANAEITISDVEGSNKIQLIGGLTISSSIVAGDTAQLTLSNGAVVTILGASTMSFEVGGNPLTGTAGVTKDYSTFVADVLGTTVPTEGTNTGSESTVNEDGTSSGGAASYSLAAGATSVDEGATATFTLTTANVADGTAVAYTISGVDAADVDGGSLTGTATVTGGTATISVALAADLTTEGAETLTVTIDGQSATASTTVNDSSVAPTSQTLTLTQGVDAITGGAGDDSINAFLDGGAATLSLLDTVDGGAGTDTLTALGMDLDNVTEGNITNVETLIVQSTSAGSIDLSKLSSVTTLQDLNSTAVSTYNNLTGSIALTVAGTSQAHVLNYSSTALSGTSDSVTLNVNGTTSVLGVTGLSTTNDIETLTINSTGSASTFELNDGGADDLDNVDKLVVTGDANLDIDAEALSVDTTTVDLSAFTATSSIKADAASTTSFVYTGGTGDDTVDIGATLTSTQTLDGGAGTDTLVVDSALTSGEAAKVTNFEVLGVDANGGAFTQDMDLVFSGVTQSSISVNGGTVTYNDVADGFVINALATMAAGQDIVANLKSDTASDDITLNIGNSSSAGITLIGFDPDVNYETITITSNGTATNTIGNFGTAFANAIFTGATALTITDVDGPTGVLDASAMTGSVNLNGTYENGATYRTGSAADDIDIDTVATTETFTLYTGDGADDIDAAAGFAGDATIYAEGGNDDINIASADPTSAGVNDIIVVDGGAGMDTINLSTTAADEQTVQSTATAVADADMIIGFDTAEDVFDYNGTLANGTTTSGVSTVEIADGSGTLSADLTTGLTANANATAYIFNNPVSGDTDTALTALTNSTASNLSTNYTTFETALISELSTVTSLDNILGTSDSVLFAFVNGADTAIVRVTNTDTSTANTLTAAEIDLVGVFDAEVLTNTQDIG